MFQIPSSPNPLTAIRIFILPLLWFFALRNWQFALALGIAFAALTDVLDGRLGKIYPQFNDIRFDSLADKLLTFSVVVWLVILKPQLITEHGSILLIAAIVHAISLFVGWRKRGRISTLHTYLGKMGGLVQVVFVVHTFLTTNYNAVLFYLSVGIFILASIEEFFIQLVYVEIDDEVVHSIIPYLLKHDMGMDVKKNN